MNRIGELNGRLTMRDAILAKVGAGHQTRNPEGANYKTLYSPMISGIPVTVDRGWNSVEVKVRNSPLVQVRQHPPRVLR